MYAYMPFQEIVKCCSDVGLGKIEPAEVKESLLQLGVNIDLAEAERLTQRFAYCVVCTINIMCLH